MSESWQQVDYMLPSRLVGRPMWFISNLHIRGAFLPRTAPSQDPAADPSWGLCVAHLIRERGSNVKSLKIKACAEIDALMVAGLSQQLKLCGGEERWMEVTLGDSGLVTHMLSRSKCFC